MDSACFQVPAAAHHYWPEGSDLHEGSGTSALRHIFEAQQYTSEEEAGIAAVEALIQESEDLRTQLPSTWTRSCILRLLYAADWDQSKVLDLVLTYLSWGHTKEEQKEAMQETALPVLVRPR